MKIKKMMKVIILIKTKIMILIGKMMQKKSINNQ